MSKQVLHSGIPVTLIPLDATRTIPVSKDFLVEYEKRQNTYEAQYCFQSLKMLRDTWINDRFHEVNLLKNYMVIYYFFLHMLNSLPNNLDFVGVQHVGLFYGWCITINNA